MCLLLLPLVIVKPEKPIFEKMHDLSLDTKEEDNLTNTEKYDEILNKMRNAWSQKIKKARGTEPPKVLRYTLDSGGSSH